MSTTYVLAILNKVFLKKVILTLKNFIVKNNKNLFLYTLMKLKN